MLRWEAPTVGAQGRFLRTGPTLTRVRRRSIADHALVLGVEIVIVSRFNLSHP